MSMNCYSYLEGNIYQNKTSEGICKKYMKKLEQKANRNRYNNLSLKKKLSIKETA